MAKGADDNWAPWYVYAIAIIGANFLKQQFMAGIPVAVNVAVTAVVVLAVVSVITAGWRMVRRPGTDR